MFSNRWLRNTAAWLPLGTALQLPRRRTDMTGLRNAGQDVFWWIDARYESGDLMSLFLEAMFSARVLAFVARIGKPREEGTKSHNNTHLQILHTTTSRAFKSGNIHDSLGNNLYLRSRYVDVGKRRPTISQTRSRNAFTRRTHCTMPGQTSEYLYTTSSNHEILIDKAPLLPWPTANVLLSRQAMVSCMRITLGLDT